MPHFKGKSPKHNSLFKACIQEQKAYQQWDTVGLALMTWSSFILIVHINYEVQNEKMNASCPSFMSE